MGSILIYSEFLKLEVSLQNPTTSFWEITLIEVNKTWKSFAFYLLIRSSILKTSSFSEVIMSVDPSIEFTDSMMNAKEDTP